MSAPAMKPLGLADFTTTPAGRRAAISVSLSANSRTTGPDSTLVVPDWLSQVSQAIPSASNSSVQLLPLMRLAGRISGS